MREYNYYVYILTNWNHKVMYIGMTNDLERRLYEHKNKLVEGFTKRYNIHTLVYYEHIRDVYEAIAREKEIKKWRREKKNKLVETMNPEWKDLSEEWELDFSPDFIGIEMTKGEAGQNNTRVSCHSECNEESWLARIRFLSR